MSDVDSNAHGTCLGLAQMEKQTEAFGCRYAEASGDNGMGRKMVLTGKVLFRPYLTTEKLVPYLCEINRLGAARF